MTNYQLICNAAIAAKLYTADEIDALHAAGQMVPLRAYQEWKKCGLQVKRGEKARLVTMLWKYTDKPSTTGDDELSKAAQEQGGGHYYMAKAHLFAADQVEKPQAVHVKTADEIKAYNAMLKAQRQAAKAAATA